MRLKIEEMPALSLSELRVSMGGWASDRIWHLQIKLAYSIAYLATLSLNILYVGIKNDLPIIHSSIEGHFVCFHVLTSVNDAAINIECIYFYRYMFCFGGRFTKEGLLGHLVILLIFWGISIMLSIDVLHMYNGVSLSHKTKYCHFGQRGCILDLD